MLRVEEVVSLLRSNRNEKNIQGMKKYGIVSKAEILGVPKPILRRIAKQIGVNHELALELWRTNVHEARILASLIADPSKIDEKTLDEWVKDIDNWDLCDQCVLNLFWKTKYATKKAREWTLNPQEFVRRAGIVLIARLALRNKQLPDEFFIEALKTLRSIINDERKYVRKAIIWALKKIGTRNPKLKDKVLKFCREITKETPRIAKETIRYIK